MKWKNKFGKIIETDEITDINYLHNLINFLIKKIEKIEEENIEEDDINMTMVGNYDAGEFYKN